MPKLSKRHSGLVNILQTSSDVGFYKKVGKRIIDICASLGGMIVLGPVFMAVALAVRIEDGGSVFFRQVRVGAKGKLFVLLKFRSMPVDTPDVASALAGGLRITRIGRILRRFNFDELPQLMNVLKGEMSLIGPRPALPTQGDVIALRKKSGADQLKPGLSGLAQVHSYDGMSAETKAEWDGLYYESVSFRTDMDIVLATASYFLKPPPVY